MTFEDLIYSDKLQLTANIQQVLSEMIVEEERNWKNFNSDKAERNALPSKIHGHLQQIGGKEIGLSAVQSWVDAFVGIMNEFGLMDSVKCEREANYTVEQVIDFVEGRQIDWEATKERFKELRPYDDAVLDAALLQSYKSAGKSHRELEKLLEGMEDAPALKIPYFSVKG